MSRGCKVLAKDQEATGHDVCEAGFLLRYFQQKRTEDPLFYYALQLDVEEKITNVFRVDVWMLIDYSYFGDAVSLETTYCTGHDHRPLVIFSGLNHHRGQVIFGVALLYDVTIDSFKWLFKNFLKAHK